MSALCVSALLHIRQDYISPGLNLILWNHLGSHISIVLLLYCAVYYIWLGLVVKAPQPPKPRHSGCVPLFSRSASASTTPLAEYSGSVPF